LASLGVATKALDVFLLTSRLYPADTLRGASHPSASFVFNRSIPATISSSISLGDDLPQIVEPGQEWQWQPVRQQADAATKSKHE
jgi:hypothetical protein